jgi:hypothetical protein
MAAEGAFYSGVCPKPPVGQLYRIDLTGPLVRPSARPAPTTAESCSEVGTASSVVSLQLDSDVYARCNVLPKVGRARS